MWPPKVRESCVVLVKAERVGDQMEECEGVYVMRVASMLSGMHPQTLRKYERAGLLTPSRSNQLRLYSDEDIVRLKMIKHLVDGLGLNLAGVDLMLQVRDSILRLKNELSRAGVGAPLEARLAAMLDDMLDSLGLRMPGKDW